MGKSLAAIRDNNPEPRYEVNTEDSGNGSLMRLTPIPIFFHKYSLEAASKISSESSYTTHPGPIAAEVCGFMGYVIAEALTAQRPADANIRTFLDRCVDDYLKAIGLHQKPEGGKLDPKVILWTLLRETQPESSTELCWDWRNPEGAKNISKTLVNRGPRYNGFPNSPGYFGSYCVDGLAIALNALYHTNDFMSAVTRCVNFLGDADTTGAICGQIAGAWYGYGAIDDRCLQNLQRWDDGEIALRAALLCVLGRDVSKQGSEFTISKAAPAGNSGSVSAPVRRDRRPLCHCCVAIYDCLRACFNPMSIRHVPCTRWRKDVHEYYYEDFLIPKKA